MPYREVRDLQKRVCSWALSGTLIAAAVFLILGERAVAKGLVLGTCFSIVNFLLLASSIPMVLGQSRRRANVIGFGSMLARYAVLVVPLVIAVKSASFHFVAVVIGVFAVQIVILLDHVVLRRILGASGDSAAGPG